MASLGGERSEKVRNNFISVNDADSPLIAYVNHAIDKDLMYRIHIPPPPQYQAAKRANL